jgi:hypothetical protein
MKKSQSQRMRAIFYLLYKQNPGKFENEEDYYQANMEKIIGILQKKLDPPPPTEENG